MLEPFFISDLFYDYNSRNVNAQNIGQSEIMQIIPREGIRNTKEDGLYLHKENAITEKVMGKIETPLSTLATISVVSLNNSDTGRLHANPSNS